MNKPTITKLKSKAWSLLSKIIRLEYAVNGYVTCYTCGVKKPVKEMQAGHGLSGRGNSILYEKTIIRPQCYGCNVCNSGKLDVFVYKLRKEIGDDGMEAMYRLKDQPRKFTVEELQARIEYYKEELRLLEDAV